MVAAFYYDGRRARRNPVTLSLHKGLLRIDGEGIHAAVPWQEVRLDEPLQGVPRLIQLPGGASCEVPDHAAFARILSAAGIGETTLVRIQRRWTWAIASLAFVIAGAAATYQWGLPALARTLAPHVPTALVRSMSETLLAQLDRRLLKKSRLPDTRQEEIRRQVDAALAAPGMPKWRIHFRSAPQIGPNALALPGGDIVLLDQLVNVLDAAEITAVVAHEIGHLAHHHGIRHLIQETALSMVLLAWFGDVSSAAVGVSSRLLQSGYSRDAEREADAFAVRQLLRCCRTAEPMVTALRKIDESVRPGGSNAFSSHPETTQRIAAIRKLAQ